jgi:hypothetical protein
VTTREGERHCVGAYEFLGVIVVHCCVASWSM